MVSVAANVAPAQMRALCDAALAGDWERATEIDEGLGPLYETLALETNPIPVKWAAFEMGLMGPTIRLPLTTLAERYRQSIRGCLEELEITRVEHSVTEA